MKRKRINYKKVIEYVELGNILTAQVQAIEEYRRNIAIQKLAQKIIDMSEDREMQGDDDCLSDF